LLWGAATTSPPPPGLVVDVSQLGIELSRAPAARTSRRRR
jgi:hypothetical protein